MNPVFNLKLKNMLEQEKNITFVYTIVVSMSERYFKTVHQLIVAGHWITDQISRELKELGYTEPQFNVLRTLREANGGPLTVQEILGKMVQRNSNVTRIVDKLIDKSAVERKECATNRRKMDITLTKTGNEILDRLEKKVSEFHQPMMAQLSPDELETLKRLIKKLINK